MRYDTLLFDADGTLLDFSRSECEALRAALASFGINADDGVVAGYEDTQRQASQCAAAPRGNDGEGRRHR